MLDTCHSVPIEPFVLILTVIPRGNGIFSVMVTRFRRTELKRRRRDVLPYN